MEMEKMGCFFDFTFAGLLLEDNYGYFGLFLRGSTPLRAVIERLGQLFLRGSTPGLMAGLLGV